ncbi:MAG: hydrogenase iron-sulfur subunit [bacterium]|nr:hydrogenase iron-sulfur subunit [bacterium]
MAEFHPKTFAFFCNWCTYTGADLAGTSRMLYPADFRVIKVPCTGRIDFEFIVKAFEQGADGVWISGCHIGDCHYNSGNYYAQRRWAIFRQELGFLGIDLRRLKFSWISAAEGRKFAVEAKEFVERITELGPYTEFHSIIPKTREAEAVTGGGN